jgi:hypothetical protein
MTRAKHPRRGAAALQAARGRRPSTLEGLQRMAIEQPEDHTALVKLLARLTAESRARQR